MSILIKGAKMPKSCGECPCICLNWSDIGCAITASRTNDVESRLPDCPLVEIPPHGRLIDADKIMARVKGAEIANSSIVDRTDAVTQEELVLSWIKEQIDFAPTVIESEEE